MFLARMAHAECRAAPVDASGSASERSELRFVESPASERSDRVSGRRGARPRTNVSEGKAASREIAPRRVARAAASPRGRPAFSRFAR